MRYMIPYIGLCLALCGCSRGPTGPSSAQREPAAAPAPARSHSDAPGSTDQPRLTTGGPSAGKATVIWVGLYSGGIDTGYVGVSAKNRVITGLHCDDNGMWFLKARVTEEEWAKIARMVAWLRPHQFRQYSKAPEATGESFGALDIKLSTGEYAMFAPIKQLCRSWPADVRERYQPVWALSGYLFDLERKYAGGSPSNPRLRKIAKNDPLWRQFDKDSERVYGIAWARLKGDNRTR